MGFINKLTNKAMQKLKWTTEERVVNDLLPYEANPRQISEKQIKDLKRSLSKYNLVEIPAIDKDGKILAGHQRIKILQLLGRGNEKIPVRIPNRKLSEKEFKEYLLISNRSGGTWDYSKLKMFDLDTLLSAGFDDSDLSSIWDDLTDVEDDDFVVEDEIKKIKTTEIKSGDMFALGRHRLLCADSTKLANVEKLMTNKKADVINTDLPYNISLSYNNGIGGKQNYGGSIDDNKSDEEYKQFVRSIIANGLKVSKENSHHFYWLDEKYIGMLQDIYKELGIEQKRLCLWLKGNQNPTPKVAFNKTTELCLYGCVGKPYLSNKLLNLNEVLNKEIGTGNRLIDDVLDMLNIWLVKRLPGQQYQHPTQKPATLYEKSLRRCSKPGDVILDLCAGSGTAMVASEQLNRTAYMLEFEPIFTQLIINRYEKLTNNKARKLN